MLLDSRNEFASATALGTGATGFALVGNVIDTSVARDLGQIDDLIFAILCTTSVGFGAAGTVAFSLASDTTAAITGTSTIHITSKTFNAANPLNAGSYAVTQELPFDTYKEFLGVLQNVGGNVLTAGAIDAFLTSDLAKWVALAAPAGV